MSAAAAQAEGGTVTLINVFEVPEGALQASIDYWKLSRDFLQTQPGYVSTALHQSIAPDAKFMLVNFAVWESAEAFKAASAKMMQTAGIAPVDGLKFTPGLYTVIETD
ncbi:antibiotic biosynthesis monooxygenase family protein [Phaeobacter inhibens]|uniref:antibiotic biosynthesis monooxygenase family protein n=1 Tax=Phaeobacter inhibens TaxID=221822 RepID=UPI0021A92571|nr:antibiotic biosynthesis monooxygenase family protein [Phaeobacter inhibens]UWR48156.1 antibiotic biosynthesis monooxygenase [Phaeobacter inhibens]UWR63656.1 antibiotic biosynthesis monooxygenase [Phaeobacter inhibens]